MIIYVAAFRDVLLDLVGRRQPKKEEAFLKCCVVGNGPANSTGQRNTGWIGWV
jgi:hypothetical protein